MVTKYIHNMICLYTVTSMADILLIIHFSLLYSYKDMKGDV